MADEEYTSPFALEKEKEEIDRMVNKDLSGFGNKEYESYVTNALVSMGFANSEQRLITNLRGINILQNQANFNVGSENMGYTFFTRPSLNLSYDNIAVVRKMVPMLTKDKNSVHRYIRASLDHLGGSRDPMAGSPAVDPLSAFIPVLTNTLETLGGWPSVNVDSYNSRAGNYKEQWAMSDGCYDIRGNYSLNASFINPPNDVVSRLFNTWTMYQSYVYDGTLAPYNEARIQRFIDYQTRCYRFVMDFSKQRILKWAACGVAYPTTNSDSDSYDFDRSKVYNDNLNRIDVSFMATGAEYNDPITLYEFNRAVEIMNRGMRDPAKNVVVNGVSRKMKGNMIKLKQAEKIHMNFMAYPYIDLHTNELEWYAVKEVHAYLTSRLGA